MRGVVFAAAFSLVFAGCGQAASPASSPSTAATAELSIASPTAVARAGPPRGTPAFGSRPFGSPPFGPGRTPPGQSGPQSGGPPAASQVPDLTAQPGAPGGPTGAPPGSGPAQTQATWSNAATPSGEGKYGGQWLDIVLPSGAVLQAVTFRPQGAGPFPVVVVLHGTDGFGEAFIQIAKDISASGFLTLAGCWFKTQPPPPGVPALPSASLCQRAPAFAGDTQDALNTALALVEVASGQPGARAGSAGIIGHSRGSALGDDLASTTTAVAAVVSSSGAYRLPQREISPQSLVARLAAPVLVLHGTADTTVNVQDAQNYESALRSAGKSVSSHYYDGADHTTWLTQPLTQNGTAFQRAVYADVLQRAIAFFSANVQ